MSKTASPQNSLIDPSANWIEIEFINEADNKPHRFYSGINKLSGSRLSSFDTNPPTINESWADIKKTIQNIVAQSPFVVEYRADPKTYQFIQKLIESK